LVLTWNREMVVYYAVTAHLRAACGDRPPAARAAGTPTRLTTGQAESRGWWGSGRYNRWMTTLFAVPVHVATGPITSPATTPDEAAIPALSPVVLTGHDADRIKAALTATIAPATRTVYTCVWGIWERWCQTRGLCAMPADPATICAYLAERADQGVAAGTLTQICSAIGYRHRTHGYADPTINDAVRQVRRGLRRLIGTAPRRQARPLSTTEIRQILDHIDRTTPKGARDAALILLGFASAMRRSELAALDLADISHRPGGILITIRRSKTDQDGAGQVVGVAPGQHNATDPVAALAAWYRQRGSQPGPVFTNLRARVAHEAISGEAISRMLRTRARSAGLEASRITGHSLRAGHATEAARAGVPLDRIAAQTRHKRVATLLERYIRPTQALQMTSSNDLGL
jgi:integrase